MKPLNTTTENVPYCMREITLGGALTIFSRNETSGICPGTQSNSGHYRCCGINDTCLGYGMCFREKVSAGRTGFYVAGCNDASYEDNVACSKVCVGEARPDVVWDGDLGVWRCCGTDASGKANCDAPQSMATGATFLAPSPDDLMDTSSNETFDGALLGTATFTGTSIAPTATTVGSGGHGGGHGLSGVATAGVAIGVIVPVVLLAVVGFILVQRRRAQRASGDIKMMNMRRWHG